ncbi:type II toxin-antitoxin system HicB family antitoxin [Methylobacterium sp. P31]
MSQLALLIKSEQGAFSASCPDFPALRPHAENLDMLLREVGRALVPHFSASSEETGEPPLVRASSAAPDDPTTRQVCDRAMAEPAGDNGPRPGTRVNISLDESLLEQVDRVAAARGETRSAFLAEAAKAWIRQCEAEHMVGALQAN